MGQQVLASATSIWFFRYISPNTQTDSSSYVVRFSLQSQGSLTLVGRETNPRYIGLLLNLEAIAERMMRYE